MRALTSFLLLSGLSSAVMAEDVTYLAADGTTVHATYERAMGKDYAPLIMLFHQAGSNGRAEYEAIAPRLLDEGYSVLMVDQRSGGDRFGGENRTAAAFDTDPGFCQSYPDLEASLAFVQESGHKGPVFAWGSSYSAGLTIKLSVDYPEELAGGLAFSPAAGTRMADCNPNPLIDQIKAPFMALRPMSEMTRPSNQYQGDLFAAAGFGVYVVDDGLHGSSMLDANRTGKKMRRAWDAVLEFLDQQSKGWHTRPASETDADDTDAANTADSGGAVPAPAE